MDSVYDDCMEVVLVYSINTKLADYVDYFDCMWFHEKNRNHGCSVFSSNQFCDEIVACTWQEKYFVKSICILNSQKRWFDFKDFLYKNRIQKFRNVDEVFHSISRKKRVFIHSHNSAQENENFLSQEKFREISLHFTIISY